MSTIYVVNRSTAVQDAQVEGWLPALNAYGADVANHWGIAHRPLAFVRQPPSADTWQIVILDDSDQAGALGYHDFTPGGKPISKIFAKSDIADGASITVTITHELAEMIVDPYTVAAWQVDATRLYALEVGDPVESDSLGYNVIGLNGVTVRVSDYALPAWFIPGAPGPYDRRAHCTAPLQVLPGGYAQVFTNGSWNQVNEHGATGAPAERASRFS